MESCQESTQLRQDTQTFYKRAFALVVEDHVWLCHFPGISGHYTQPLSTLEAKTTRMHMDNHATVGKTRWPEFTEDAAMRGYVRPCMKSLRLGRNIPTSTRPATIKSDSGSTASKT